MTSSDPRTALVPIKHSRRSFPERRDSLRGIQGHLKGRRRPTSTNRKQHPWYPRSQDRWDNYCCEEIQVTRGTVHQERELRTLQSLLVTVMPPHQQPQPTTERWLWARPVLNSIYLFKHYEEGTINSILHSRRNRYRKVNPQPPFVNLVSGGNRTWTRICPTSKSVTFFFKYHF